ncbi:MAG: hypothetical protein FWD55_00385 [Propionibacteriaceae bacterium]|nr:hypothetical protein [Propionibacteriaceae bacterium]
MDLRVNTHVHIPPNFSAFTTPADVITAAQEQGIAALGLSNFYDHQVYTMMRDLAQDTGITLLYGVEFITVIEELEAQGVRINDPANPGRMYLTGKGIDPFRTPSARASRIASFVRQGNDQRAEMMVARLAAHFADHGCDTGLDAQTIIDETAQRSGVPSAWVSLQERHIAAAFQVKLFQFAVNQRSQILQRVYGAPSMVRIEDPGSVQSELRARLLKAGTPGFVPEVPLSFEDGYAYILDMGGIPCYPILADGVSPLCPFESSPKDLADQLLQRGIYAGELIPVRNHSAVVDQYIRDLHDASLIVLGGTEHNTGDLIPLDPYCLDAELSDYARTSFVEAACIVAAHAENIRSGYPGYVTSTGELAGGVQALMKSGERLLR